MDGPELIEQVKTSIYEDNGEIHRLHEHPMKTARDARKCGTL